MKTNLIKQGDLFSLEGMDVQINQRKGYNLYI